VFEETNIVKTKNSNRVTKYYRNGGTEEGPTNICDREFFTIFVGFRFSTI
jgi:hypothetical protein